MNESNHFTPCASLALFGLQFQYLAIWQVVAQQVQIKQKVRTYTPLEKLQDCFVNILAGGHGISDINQRVRTDKSLQLALNSHDIVYSILPDF